MKDRTGKRRTRVLNAGHRSRTSGAQITWRWELTRNELKTKTLIMRFSVHPRRDFVEKPTASGCASLCTNLSDLRSVHFNK